MTQPRHKGMVQRVLEYHQIYSFLSHRSGSRTSSGRLAANPKSKHDRIKRGLAYGVAPVFYGNLREQTGDNGFDEYLQEACFVLTEISENLRKTPGVYGRV